MAIRAKDEARTVEWAIHSYSEMATYGLTLAFTWASRALFPTGQDAFAHAAVAATMLGSLLGYIASIYLMKPEPEPVSAFRNGMFWDFRRSGSKEAAGKAN